MIKCECGAVHMAGTEEFILADFSVIANTVLKRYGHACFLDALKFALMTDEELDRNFRQIAKEDPEGWEQTEKLIELMKGDIGEIMGEAFRRAQEGEK